MTAGEPNERETMPWKMDGDKLAIKDGDPIWITDDQKETTVAGNTIGRLNGEAKAHRERAEAAEAKLANFAGIDDPAAALNALATVKDIDASKLIKADKLDELKGLLNKEWGEKHGKVEKANADLRSELDNLRLTNAFASSTFIKERVAVPAEMFQSTFGRHFKVENGKVVAYAPDGKTPLLSPARMGEPADIDEAFELLVKDYPGRDTILKAAPARGSGNGGAGGNAGGKNTMRRAEWEALPMHEQAAKMPLMTKGELVLVD